MSTKNETSANEPDRKKYYVPNPAEGVYRANLDALNAKIPGTGSAVEHLLSQVEESPIAIEDDVRIQGLKNPITLVIIGFATRKVLESARKSKKDIQQVIIIEPDKAVFKQTLRREYIADLIIDDNIEFVAGVPLEELQANLFKIFAKADEKNGPRAAKILAPEVITDPFVYPAKDQKKKEEADRIFKIVLDTKAQVFLSMGCASDGFNRWERMITNIPNIQSGYRIEPLFNKFSELPAIVVGAGPSMQGFIDAYKTMDLEDKSIVIACDAALVRLLKEGIRPNFVTRCERKLTTIFDGLKKEDTKDIFYAGYPWCAKEYFDLFQEFFMLFRGNGVCKWTGYNPGEVNGGVSSANAALELALLFGTKNIVLTGIDLCFLDGQSHVAGTEVEFDPEKSRAKWETIKANDGSEQTTIPVWKRCHAEYRHALFRHEQRKVSVFNTSLKGAAIHGAKYMDWKDLECFGAKADVTARIRQFLDRHAANYEASFNEKKSKTIETLKNVQKDLKKLFLFLDDAMLNTKREEEKVMRALKSNLETHDFFNGMEGVKKSLTGVFAEPCRQIDAFKSKHYVNQDFNQLILDMCQLDFYTSENHMHSLKNRVPVDHERLKAYVGLHYNLFCVFDFYVEKMLSLFEKGPEPSKYDETEDLLLAEARP